MRREFVVPLRTGTKLFLGRRTLIVGVLNVTPDSFSDGGQYLDSGCAVARAAEMETNGAAIIEVGGESTRPGAPAVTAEEEKARVLPVVRQLAKATNLPIAVDTYKSGVAQAALDLGAAIVNDVSALRFDPALAGVAARERAVLVLMHMRGDPATMQQIEPSPNILAEIESDLGAAAVNAVNAGVPRSQIILDPGIGFGKTLQQNLEIINQLACLESLGFPLMIGTSRKSFIGKLTGRPALERIFGTAASAAAAITRGAHLIRVHDVKEMAEVALITDSIIAQDVPAAGTPGSGH